METLHNEIAVLIVRVVLGVLFFFQGYDKVFKVGVKKVSTTFKAELGDTVFPGFIITLAAYYTSFTELIGGFLLIVGLFKYYMLYALGLDIILVTVALGSIEPLWRMDYVFPRLVLLLVLLLVPASWDYFSADQFAQGS